MKTKSYKTRCEFLADAGWIMSNGPFRRVTVETTEEFRGLDCTIEFESELTLKEIRKEFKRIESLKCAGEETGVELHVAIEAINTLEKYDGERYYRGKV